MEKRLLNEMTKNYQKIIEEESFYNSKLFPKKDILFSRGKGALLYDINGNEYLDCVGGHGVMNIGYSHPKYIEKIHKQVEELLLVPQGYPVEERYKLLKKLAEITPKSLSQTFLSNSGTESVEAAIKLVLAANRDIKNPEIIAFKRSFHGRSLGSLALTYTMKYRKAFISWLSPHVRWASFDDIESVKELVNENTVAIFIELIQGEGGVYPASESFIKELRELCENNDLILVDDEVQTGFGRTGKMFAYEHYNIVPDVICMAKGIAGGLPMGATIASSELYNKMMIGEHNTTFGGNPLVCCAANAVIDIIKSENLVQNSEKQGKKLISAFIRLAEDENKHIRDVRGLGLMIGIDYRIKIKKLLNKAQEMNLLLLNAGLTTLRLLPPLVINNQQVDKIIKIIQQL
ncbi:MAG: acetylornithine/succinylornithine family transaminase [Candidatus Lokiarchaeota archaeon]|nr:acetylornithine/succinylornithine family transaminase [Candidatus Lokiarchaeota archaeon]